MTGASGARRDIYSERRCARGLGTGRHRTPTGTMTIARSAGRRSWRQATRTYSPTASQAATQLQPSMNTAMATTGSARPALAISPTALRGGWSSQTQTERRALCSIMHGVPSEGLELRSANPGDIPLLRVLIREAAFWRCAASAPPLERALADPAVGRYVEDFGRAGDRGVIAVLEGLAVGAAWCRCFQADAPGYGFVDESVPEVSIAVLPGHRGAGIGTELMNALRHEAQIDGIARLSLSVERDNPAYALYERVGFRPVGRDTGAQTMVLDLASGRAR